jgi:two-component system, LuxR family, response regulator FixJ
MSTPGLPPSPGRIWLVDDNAEFRDSAAWWLEGLGYEVTQFEGPAECLAALATEGGAEGPICLLFDVRMPEMSGLQLLDMLRERGVGWPVIFMTGHGDVPLAVEAMRKGALTFLEKPFQEAALEEALGQAFAACARAASVGDGAEAEPELRARLDTLTPREAEVMELVVAGHPNKVVAFKLGISPKTVELHRSRVMSKMKATSLTQLVRMNLSGRVDG